jgi:hypothetical protein
VPPAQRPAAGVVPLDEDHDADVKAGDSPDSQAEAREASEMRWLAAPAGPVITPAPSPDA